MKVLLLEYITAGGLAGQPLPVSLLREGTMMRHALLTDFSMVANTVQASLQQHAHSHALLTETLEIVTTHDARLSHATLPFVKSTSVMHAGDAIPLWQAMLNTCDAALVVAPESDGILYELTKMIERAGVINLGAHSSAVTLTSNKYFTYQKLLATHILTIETYQLPTFVALATQLPQTAYVVKPIDGAGCEHTLYFTDQFAVLAWVNALEQQAIFADKAIERFIVQPYQSGYAASISMLCQDGQAWVLSCNQQCIQIEGQVFCYRGTVVNGFGDYRKAFTKLAREVAAAMPSLHGYVGIDVIVDGEAVYVVEINPRITTSYVALHDSLTLNPVQLLLDLSLSAHINQPFTLSPQMTQHAIEVNLHA